MKFFRFLIGALAIILFSGNAMSYHPLITDDTGTQGKGRFQFEFNGEYGHDKEDGITTDTIDFNATLTYGIIDALDLAVGMPYQFIKVEDGFSEIKEDGVSDISINMKWRFFSKDNLSLALKPEVTLPTGDEERELGSGKVTYGLFFIATEDLKPFGVHMNVGYKKNSNKLDERTDIWHASIAGEYEVFEGLRLAMNTGIETNPDKSSRTHPVFILGGIVYSMSDVFDIDFGIKAGINKPETDTSLMAGITFRF